MAAEKLRIADLSPFDHAASGHDGVLSDPSGDLIIKPCTPDEIAFYEECAKHPAINAVIPTYMGTLALSTTAEKEALKDQIPATIHVSEGSVQAVLGSKGKRLNTKTAIVLENVAAGFQKPNILDVKLGIRLWADDATPEKRNKLDKVSSETTSGSLGLRITGMRVWEPSEGGLGEYRMYGKEYGRQFTAQNVRKGFEQFFYANKGKAKELTPARREVLRRLSNEVGSIEDVLEDEETRMYSSSILFVYEGDDDALQALLTEEENQEKQPKTSIPRDSATDHEHDGDDDDNDDDDDDDDDGEDEGDDLRICSASLIDFAHASFTDGEGKDENTLRGVRNLRNILDSMLLQP